MRKGYQELLEFHVAAQHGHFIDEIVSAPQGAGVMIFSCREAEAMWNVLFVANAAEAESHRGEIARVFNARRRRPVWYLPDGTGAALSPVWSAIGRNSWMIRPRGPAYFDLPAGETLVPVETPIQARMFNQLYIDVYWESAPPPDVALPINTDNAPAATATAFVVRHWLLLLGHHPVAMLTTIARGGLCAIYNVGTHPQFTRHGYASRAILAVLARLDSQGCEASFLLTECNERLAPFYARLGFATVATGQFHVCTGEGA